MTARPSFTELEHLRLTAPIEMPYDYFVCVYTKIGTVTWMRDSAYTTHCQHAGASFASEWWWAQRRESGWNGGRSIRKAVVWYGQVSPPLFLYELPMEVSDEPRNHRSRR